jgi:hypothetical protein
LSGLFGTLSMFIEDRLGTAQVSGLDPDLGPHAWNVADAGFQVVAEHPTANALLFERLLPEPSLNFDTARFKMSTWKSPGGRFATG